MILIRILIITLWSTFFGSIQVLEPIDYSYKDEHCYFGCSALTRDIYFGSNTSRHCGVNTAKKTNYYRYFTSIINTHYCIVDPQTDFAVCPYGNSVQKCFDHKCSNSSNNNICISDVTYTIFQNSIHFLLTVFSTNVDYVLAIFRDKQCVGFYVQYDLNLAEMDRNLLLFLSSCKEKGIFYDDYSNIQLFDMMLYVDYTLLILAKYKAIESAVVYTLNFSIPCLVQRFGMTNIYTNYTFVQLNWIYETDCKISEYEVMVAKLGHSEPPKIVENSYFQVSDLDRCSFYRYKVLPVSTIFHNALEGYFIASPKEAIVEIEHIIANQTLISIYFRSKNDEDCGFIKYGIKLMNNKSQVSKTVILYNTKFETYTVTKNVIYTYVIWMIIDSLKGPSQVFHPIYTGVISDILLNGSKPIMINYLINFNWTIKSSCVGVTFIFIFRLQREACFKAYRFDCEDCDEYYSLPNIIPSKKKESHELLQCSHVIRKKFWKETSSFSIPIEVDNKHYSGVHYDFYGFNLMGPQKLSSSRHLFTMKNPTHSYFSLYIILSLVIVLFGSGILSLLVLFLRTRNDQTNFEKMIPVQHMEMADKQSGSRRSEYGESKDSSISWGNESRSIKRGVKS